MEKTLSAQAYAEWVNAVCRRNMFAILNIRRALMSIAANQLEVEHHFINAPSHKLAELLFDGVEPIPAIAKQLAASDYTSLLAAALGRVLAELNYPVTPEVQLMASYTLVYHYDETTCIEGGMADAELVFINAWRRNAQRMTTAAGKPTLDVRSEGLTADKTPRSWLFYETWAAGGIMHSAMCEVKPAEHLEYYWGESTVPYHLYRDEIYPNEAVILGKQLLQAAEEQNPRDKWLEKDKVPPKFGSFELAMKHLKLGTPQVETGRTANLHLSEMGLTLRVRAPSLAVRPLFANGPGRVERGPTSEKSGKETYRSPKGNVYPRPRASFGRGRR